MSRGLRNACSVLVILGAAGMALAAAPQGGVCEPTPEAGRDMQAALDSAIESIARERGVEPGRKRSLLLAALARSQACYASDLTEEQLIDILRRTSALPPGMDARGLRFETETKAWLGEATITEAGTARAARLTYSFPADGTSWGSACGGLNIILPSALDASLVQTFGSLDRGREYIRSALASYRRVAGLTYTEVPDDGTAMTMSTARVSTRGDIRIAGIPLGSPTFQPLAYNAFPQGQSVSSCAGGDMVINTSAFTSQFLSQTNFDRRYFRNCIAHEHGHGLGLIHTVPCNSLKLMEPFIYATRELLGNDDIRGVQRNYGDRYAGNNTQVTARDLGNLTSPTLRSVIERDLSINGTGVVIDGLLVSTDDWFRFTLDSPQTVSVTVAPTGATVPPGTTCSSSTLDPAPCVGRQTSGCSGTVGLVNASQAGNLSVEMRDSTGLTVIDFAGGAPAGSSETFTRALNPGTYLLRIQDAGGTLPANQSL
ncbi:MAG: matrixin family metalloprotease, partial [Phycisphaerales bacterium]|nr:matrixin family metalloprotease [Phycisphaerales bacterium]